MKLSGWIIVAGMAGFVGCAAKPVMHAASEQRSATTMRAPATTQTSDRALLDLDEITPTVNLDDLVRRATTREASTQASTRPSVDALELFARGRDALLQRQWFTAINSLEKAIKLDPESYELRFNLGMAYEAAGSSTDDAIKAYEAAERIEPDHLDLQTELGREYLTKGNVDKALEHLQLAMQTEEYRHDDPLSAVAENYLARCLEVRGYEKASAEVYQRLLDRLERGGLPARISPELAYLVMRPEEVAARLGEIYEKLGDYDKAVKAYEFVAERRPEMFDAYNRIVMAMLKGGHAKEAEARATELVQRFKASTDSIKLLKQVYEKNGGNAAVAEQLQTLHKENPSDRAILYALVDVLSSSNRDKEAIEVLDLAAKRNNYDPQTVDQLFKLYDKSDDTIASARLLIMALAKRPDSIRDLGDEWTSLLRYSRRNRITIAKLQSIQVPPEAQASKLLWISRLAQLWNRDILARTSLEQSVKLTPPFAPSYRVLVVDYATRADWDTAKRERETKALIDSVRAQGERALAMELDGLVSLAQGRAADAAKKFAQAMKLGGNSIDLRLSYATALRGAGEELKSEQTLWKLVEDEPNCEDAYAALFRGYIEQREVEQAMPVLRKWLSNNPNSINAQIVQAAILLQARQPDRAKTVLLNLFERDPDNTDVLSALNAFYQRTGKTDEFIAKLEAERAKHPENRVAIEYLVNIYAAQKRLPDAIRVLDATRKAVAGDPDLLYYVGSLYARVEQKKTQEEILEQIVEKDPNYAPASNDLGYTWADRGDNLNRAEELVRVALKEEPDNQSYLDSLGWVLYKRGKFAEARKYLDEAIAPASYPDPVVLDHLGDVLYRLGDKSEALKQWKRSQERLSQSDQERDDLAKLGLQLRQKITQAEDNQSVSVAPTAATEK